MKSSRHLPRQQCNQTAQSATNRGFEHDSIDFDRRFCWSRIDSSIERYWSDENQCFYFLFSLKIERISIIFVHDDVVNKSKVILYSTIMIYDIVISNFKLRRMKADGVTSNHCLTVRYWWFHWISCRIRTVRTVWYGNSKSSFQNFRILISNTSNCSARLQVNSSVRKSEKFFEKDRKLICKVQEIFLWYHF